MNNEIAQPQKEEPTEAIPTLLKRLIYLSFALTVVSTMVGLLFCGVKRPPL
jgi:hypothetical protein